MRKRRRLIVIFVIILISASALVKSIRPHYVAPILMYHSVSQSPSPENRLAVSVKTFERQMHFLKTHHYNVVPLEQLAGLIKEKKKVPWHTLAITFDDGYKDNFVYAYPILKKYTLPATIFILVNEVGRAQNDRLSWDEIRDMQNSGIIVFGSHTLNHPYLPEVSSDAQVKKEIFESKRILEEKLNKKIVLFSYPAGRFTPKIKQLVMDAGYYFAVATNPGKKIPNDDIFALKRLRISQNADNLFVFWIETSGFYNLIREHRHKKNTSCLPAG